VSGYKFATMQDVKRIAKAVIRSERAVRGGGETYGLAGSKNQIWFPFKNTYAGTIPAYSVVEIVDCIAVPGLDLSYFTVTRPSTTFRGPSHYAVTSAESVVENGTGQLRFHGTCRVAYDSGTPAKFEGWGPKPGQFTLSKGYPGLVSVHRIENTTSKWLLGTLTPITKILCKATADNAAGSLATDTSDYKIQSGTAGSEADAGFTTQPAIYAREATSNNEFFTATFVNNAWYADIETGRILMYKAKLNGALAATDANATIDNVTCFGGGTAPSPTSAANTLDLAGSDNDDCVVIKDGTGYYLINVMHHAC
jgi:hypothetical protein